MEKKFSKGKWIVSDDTGECYLVKSDDGGLIAFVYDGDIDEEAIHMDVVEANAKLISLAPDLLDACVDMIKYFDQQYMSQCDAYFNMKALIKKATE